MILVVFQRWGFLLVVFFLFSPMSSTVSEKLSVAISSEICSLYCFVKKSFLCKFIGSHSCKQIWLVLPILNCIFYLSVSNCRVQIPSSSASLIKLFQFCLLTVCQYKLHVFWGFVSVLRGSRFLFPFRENNFLFRHNE